jgi:hypothetical protein
MDQPWEHPDWYDLHDTTWTAGPEREPEHYRELMLALPPLGGQDHLADVGAGTGKLAGLIAGGYSKLGRVSLLEPNQDKLERARERITKLLPHAKIQTFGFPLGEDQKAPQLDATVVTAGSVFMPVMELRGGTLANGLAWLRKSLAETLGLLRPGGWAYVLETLAAPWARGSANDPVRRLNMLEFMQEITDAGFGSVECVYRFRDRVAVRAGRPPNGRDGE